MLIKQPYSSVFFFTARGKDWLFFFLQPKYFEILQFISIPANHSWLSQTPWHGETSLPICICTFGVFSISSYYKKYSCISLCIDTFFGFSWKSTQSAMNSQDKCSEFFCVWMFFLCGHVDPWSLELQTVVVFHVGAESPTWVLWKTSQYS